MKIEEKNDKNHSIYNVICSKTIFIINSNFSLKWNRFGINFWKDKYRQFLLILA